MPHRCEMPLFSIKAIRYAEEMLFKKRPSFLVMSQAAEALFNNLQDDLIHDKSAQTVHVVLGLGNNAGDALLLSTLLTRDGYKVKLYGIFGDSFSGDAAKAYAQAKSAGLTILPFWPFDCQPNDIIVEGLFGIGVDRPIVGKAKSAIEHINHSKLTLPTIKVYAVDVPAGIDADTGSVFGIAVRADKTVTFIGDKIGLHTSDGKSYSGEVFSHSLGAEHDIAPRLVNQVHRYHYERTEVNKHATSHKGEFGHALIIGGDKGMFGAAALSSVSTLKVGTGKASLFTHPDYEKQFHIENTHLYEVMREQFLSNINNYSAIVLGVGLGRNNWGKETFDAVQAINSQPLVIDADGLWHLANSEDSFNISVVTPHEAEAARLLDTTVEHVRKEKLQCVRELANKYHCIAVLKGAGTLVSDGEQVWINESGNVCLATAGTGDVLAGMIGGFLAQGFTAPEAALYGVYRHGNAADNYVNIHNEKTLRASDLWDYY